MNIEIFLLVESDASNHTEFDRNLTSAGALLKSLYNGQVQDGG